MNKKKKYTYLFNRYKKKKHIFLFNRNKNNKGIIEEIEKAYEMKLAMPLHIMPLIEKTLYELCDVRANIPTWVH